MKKFTYIGLVAAVTLGISGCSYQGGDEDPTNIEMEVLRASLLEKELQMDELRATIDEQIEQNDELSYKIEDLESEALRQKRITQSLIDNAHEQLQVKDTQEHYYRQVGEDLYIIMTYQDYDNDYGYDTLMHYRDGEEGNLVYQGNDIQFGLDISRDVIYILDGTVLSFLTMDYNVINEVDFSDQLASPDHNIQLLKMSLNTGPYLYLTFSGGQDDEESMGIYGVAEVDYNNPENLKTQTVSISTSDYVISPKNRSVYYSYYGISEPVNLTRYRFESNDHIPVDKNSNSAFSPYIMNDQLVYYSESIDGEKTVEIDGEF